MNFVMLGFYRGFLRDIKQGRTPQPTAAATGIILSSAIIKSQTAVQPGFFYYRLCNFKKDYQIFFWLNKKRCIDVSYKNSKKMLPQLWSRP